MAQHNVAIRVLETNEDDLTSAASGLTKLCPGCDPDVPGHVEPRFCKKCKGTRRVPMGFMGAFAELKESRANAMTKSGSAKSSGSSRKAMDDSDGDWLEY